MSVPSKMNGVQQESGEGGSAKINERETKLQRLATMKRNSNVRDRSVSLSTHSRKFQSRRSSSVPSNSQLIVLISSKPSSNVGAS